MSRGVAFQLEQRWECPACGLTDVTHEYGPITRYHTCPATRSLSVPMLPAGVRAKISVNEREDYINGDLVQRDENGRPIMSITTEREDGIDCVAFAPTAVATISPRFI